MPGIASLDAGQYYAHPHNAFWRIMGELVGAGPDKSYDLRVRVLQKHRIAVWDVLASCIRPGSLDSDITDEHPNDFESFFGAHSGIAVIGLNGGKAAACFRKHAARHCPNDVRITQLPSTSSAHAARSFDQKYALWRAALTLD